MLGGVTLIVLLVIASLVRNIKQKGGKQDFPDDTPALDSTPVFEMGTSQFPVKRPGHGDDVGSRSWSTTANGEMQHGKWLSELP